MQTKTSLHSIIAFLLLSFSWHLSQAQTDLYDPNIIQDIKLYFGYSDWDYRLDTANAGSEGYILADSVVINGITFDSVGVKYKGNSSYNANNNKNPMHIELDYVHGNADYQGYTDIKLGNCYSDPSMLREPLSYDILSQYMHCPKANFANLYINGGLRGLYNNAEAINKKFVGNHFFSNDGSLFKCNPQSIGGPGGGTYPSLEYLGTDSSLYYTRYELKSDRTWQDLVDLCDTLKNYATNTNLEKILDVDRALWMLSFNNVLVNLDSYSGAFKQNYYLYEDQNNRMNSIIWDLNMSFGGFKMSGSGAQLTLATMQSLTPTLHQNDAAWPLIQKLLADARFKKMYIAHMRTINNENFADSSYKTKALAMMSLIAPSVQADPYKFYTYTQFQNSLEQTASGGGPMGGTVGIAQLMRTRNTYLQNTTEFQQTPPTITNVAPDNNSPSIGATVTITANISNSTYAYLGYRYLLSQKFTKVQMFDDGAHNDGAAGDGVFGASFPLSAAQAQYYIYADNANAGMFSPERAEYEFYTINAKVDHLTSGDVVINELLAINTTTQTTSNGQYNDWIELYNNTSNPVNLGTLYLSDDYTVPLKWAFPVNATILPNDYLIVWADQDSFQSGYHANFKLASGGEQLILSYADGTILDSISFPTQTADISYGRYPNGTGAFQAMPPTYSAQNTLFVAIETPSQNYVVAIYPNPATETLHIDGEGINKLELIDLSGRILKTIENEATQHQFEVNDLATGIYLVRINEQTTKKVVVER